MRSPVIAFSILAAAAVSPVLVSGAPTSPKLGNAMVQTDKLATGNLAHQVRDVPLEDVAKNLPIPSSSTTSTASSNPSSPVERENAMKKAKAQMNQPDVKAAVPPPAAKMSKRASDMYTAGGNAYSGAASDSSGGDVQNASNQGTLTNGDGSNAAGGAGSSFSGFSFGGNGNGHGPGGNAYTGATGASRGGNVVNTSEGGDADAIDNTTANTAGGGGFSESGSAEGGNAAGPPFPDGLQNVQRRASDSGTAGGNAYSGATSDVSGGSVVNAADDQGTVTNGGGSKHCRWRRHHVLWRR
ncbi:hypothetical protein L227DRAFT_561885 [Lentinus tigrinus ALCF2SS1-6]|uniref:Uncharacterized protein n=1 Tax=Lentinus tigrinus ALCF2SS1-6 TaxID=1328759 RepID=A0A5C2SHS7_9APHY|nr:hypothetical protein L227DRAFT_561885 [Lentinus tigrinus ALCF2SS1-6]